MKKAPKNIKVIFCTCIMFLLMYNLLISEEISNTFESSTEGWEVVNYPFRSYFAAPGTSELTFDSANGNPSGSVRVGDVFAETGITAPMEYLGNKANFHEGILEYDIFLRYTDNVVYPAVVLNGGGMSVYYDNPSPPLNVWTTMTIPLTESGWFLSGYHTPATYEEFMSILSNLTGFYIYTEWHTGADDTNVDNVVISYTLNLSAPQNVFISVSNNTVFVQWDAAAGATSYKIYSDTDPFGTFSTIEWEGTATNWSETATELKKFYYVTANN